LGVTLGQCISLDTKHILAWVKENNLKTYIADRYDKRKQPDGDPDCRLGCKRRHNKRGVSAESIPTPTQNPRPVERPSGGRVLLGVRFWRGGDQVPEWGELVLAELRALRPSRRLLLFPLNGRARSVWASRPSFGAFDAAFDAFYVYEYFQPHRWPGGFAPCPFPGRPKEGRFFSRGPAAVCCGLPMTLRYTFIDHTHLFDHQRGRYGCPSATHSAMERLPRQHKNWAKEGCIATMPHHRRQASLPDRPPERRVPRRLTAAHRSERINAQAVDLGIERPHIVTAAIANLNTLIYILIDLRSPATHRQHKREQSCVSLAA